MGFWVSGAQRTSTVRTCRSRLRGGAHVKRGPVRDGLAAIDAAWRELAPDIACDVLLRMSFSSAAIATSTESVAFYGHCIFALVIAVMGLVGMAVHIVGRRTHEVGVRKTLGASQSRVLAMLMSDFSKPVLSRT